MKQYGKQVFEEAQPSPDELRGRDSLLLMAQLRTAGSTKPITVRIRNISAGGLMAELPDVFPTDDSVEIEVRGIGWISGRIAWQIEGRAGIAFDHTIDPRRARKPVGGATKSARTMSTPTRAR